MFDQLVETSRKMERGGIVVIEDDIAVNDGIVMILERAGYQVHPFLSAAEFENGRIDSPDLYLIDWHLKGDDGIALCKRIKSQETGGTETAPVVVMSASPEARRYVEDAGADAFLQKPFSRKQLLTILSQLIKPEAGV